MNWNPVLTKSLKSGKNKVCQPKSNMASTSKKIIMGDILKDLSHAKSNPSHFKVSENSAFKKPADKSWSPEI